MTNSVVIASMVSKQSTEPRSKLEEELSNLFLLGMKGEKQEYKHFLNVLSKYLRGYFYKKMQSAPDFVEDLVQEVLIAVHNKRHTYQPQEPLTPWLHAIAKYKYVDFLRAKKHEHLNDSLDDSQELWVEEIPQAFESHTDLTLLMSDLPESHRVAIELTKINGLSVKDAAQMSGLSESAIKVGVHRGLKKLATLIRKSHENT